MEDKHTLGQFIMQKRKEQSLTQKQLADALYVTESAVSKWERGLSYPDITLLSELCRILQVSEHELIIAGEDYKQRQTEKQAKSYRRMQKGYSWFFYVTYGLILLICFICNLASSHTLSWFFIVLASVLLAFSVTNLPLLIQKHRFAGTVGGIFLTLNLLLLTCCIFTQGNWFFITFVSLAFAFCVLFLPGILRSFTLPKPLDSHKTLICFTADTLLLTALVAAGMAYSGTFGKFFSVGLPVMLFQAALPWLIMLSLRYLPINGLLKTAVCLLLLSGYMFFDNSVLSVLIDGAPFHLPVFNLYDWSEVYINGNVTLIISAVFLLLALLFTIGGILIEVHRARRS